MDLDKKAQGLSVTTIILMVLGVLILVILIIGFTMGWGSFKNWITGGGSNVDQVVTSCQAACASLSKYSYCSQQREITIDGESKGEKSCYQWAKQNTEYGIELCSGLTCEVCKGTREDCSDINNEIDCNAANGCSYDSTGNNCQAIADGCSEVDLSKCASIDGCNIVAA